METIDFLSAHHLHIKHLSIRNLHLEQNIIFLKQAKIKGIVQGPNSDNLVEVGLQPMTWSLA